MLKHLFCGFQAGSYEDTLGNKWKRICVIIFVFVFMCETEGEVKESPKNIAFVLTPWRLSELQSKPVFVVGLRSGSVRVKFDRSKSPRRCQRTSQISVHMADVIPGPGQGAGTSSAGQMKRSLCLCEDSADVRPQHQPLFPSGTQAWLELSWNKSSLKPP